MIGLSQSAVSHSVKELEHQTGVRLLDRTTREVVLTEAGQQLAGRLERLLDELTITLRDAGRVGQQLSGTVKGRRQSNDFRPPYSAVYCSQQSSLSRYRFCAAIGPSGGCWRYPPVDFGIVIDPGPAADLQCEVVLAEPFCCSVGRIILCQPDRSSVAGAAG